MFTGIIEELGTLVERNEAGTGLRLLISADRVFRGDLETPQRGSEISQNGLKIDDSISVNGVCQTVVAVRPPYFEVIAVQETLQKTTLGSLKVGERDTLNLERAATLSTRLGGHLVQGHVDGTAVVLDIRDLNGSWEFYFELPEGFARYVIPVGSVSIDGVSLTVASIEANILKVAIIPHTYVHTNFQFIRIGDKRNIELDLMAKMVERMMKPYHVSAQL